METTVEKIKAWFGITDEAIAEKVAAEAASAKQSLQDQITSHQSEIARLQSELDAMETPAEEVVETPAEEASEPQG